MVAQATSPENHKLLFSVYAKIILMNDRKSPSKGLLLWNYAIPAILSICLSVIFLSLNPQNVSALFVPTLSASIDQTSLHVNGNQVINSTDHTTEIPLRLTVNTTNRTGYTATISSSSEDTALTNSSPSASDKINSILSAATLNSLPNNTWGYKVASETNYNPIPSLNSPSTFLQTTAKTNGSESNNLSFGMKLSSSLESGSYENTLIITVISNPYEQQAIIRDHLNSLIGMISFRYVGYAIGEKYTNIHHIKWCPSLDQSKISTYTKIDSAESDYPVYMWMDFDNHTLYFCSESNKVYFNKNSKEAFSMLENLEDIDLSHFSTEKVENMGKMFYWDKTLKTIDLSNFSTSNVTDMSSMFSKMEKIKNIDLSNFDTSKVEDMNNMFRDAKSIESITFGSKFNTSKVTSMASMFSDTPKLKSLDLSNFDTSNVTDMNSMFNYTLSLSSLKFGPNFVTDKVEDMLMMFVGTCSLDSLDLSTFRTNKLTNVTKMFALLDWDNISFECLNGDKLKNIYTSEDFDISNINQSADVFTGRKNLRGGAGSFLSDPSTADKTWLRIDDPTNSRPGYFTRKP